MKNLSRFIPLIFLILTSCGRTEFSADTQKTNPDSIVGRPECQDIQKDSVGAHIAFVIDNSGSNGSSRIATDCPGIQLSGSNGICTQATMRETATLAGVEYLEQLTQREAQNPLAESSLSLISFPGTLHLGAVSTGQQASQRFANALSFTRRPDGFTPLYQGISAATGVLNRVASNDPRAKVMIIVTDGFNTDTSLSPIYQEAQSFRNNGGKIFTITNTDGQNKAERVAYYSELINNRSQWSNEYSNADYISIVAGQNGREPLLKEISDYYFEIDNASQMPEVMQKIVVNGAVDCI